MMKESATTKRGIAEKLNRSLSSFDLRHSFELRHFTAWPALAIGDDAE